MPGLLDLLSTTTMARSTLRPSFLITSTTLMHSQALLTLPSSSLKVRRRQSSNSPHRRRARMRGCYHRARGGPQLWTLASPCNAASRQRRLGARRRVQAVNGCFRARCTVRSSSWHAHRYSNLSLKFSSLLCIDYPAAVDRVSRYCRSSLPLASTLSCNERDEQCTQNELEIDVSISPSKQPRPFNSSCRPSLYAMSSGPPPCSTNDTTQSYQHPKLQSFSGPTRHSSYKNARSSQRSGRTIRRRGGTSMWGKTADKEVGHSR
ncbi:hypothetical protein C8F01DRAFT_1360659 [Mycena amicta]|nr:hypothetical protein C8F01DRAFT_1360659 [Mycena amicta]